MEKKEDLAKNIRILGHRLQHLCYVLQTLQVSMPPGLILSLYFYQQSLTEEVKEQLQKYIGDDDELNELLQQRLFDISLSELLWQSSVMPAKNKDK